MKKSYLVVAAAGLPLTLGASAEAGGRGGGAPMTPSGFGSAGGHNGFETFTHTTGGAHPTITQQRLPPGWDEGKAGWKSNLQSPNPILTTRPPGLSR